MILLTGAAGFIGSCLLGHLNQLGHQNIILVDDFRDDNKDKNLHLKKYARKVHRSQLFDWLALNKQAITVVYHLGARTDTTEKNSQIFHRLNLSYSKKIWQFCTTYQLPLVYASSAATYGLGDVGFQDSHSIVGELQPLNPYAVSKNEFDKWALQQNDQPPFWAGLKFFNVYGPNEYHKSRMASVVFHAYHQIKKTGQMNLFRSHHPNFADGMQARDFIYVKDVVRLCSFFMQQQANNGLYNVGTGKARTFLDLVHATFDALDLSPTINFIDTPIDIRATYQYFTEADMQKTMTTGYDGPFISLEKGIKDYVQNFLCKNTYL